MNSKTTEEKIEAIYSLADFEIADAIDSKWKKDLVNFIPQNFAAHNLKNLLEACDRHSIKVIKANGKVLLSSKVKRPVNVKVNPSNHNEDESKRFDRFFEGEKPYPQGYVGSTFRVILA